MHALGENLLDVDEILERVRLAGLTPSSLAVVFAIAGFDFAPGTSGVPHDAFLAAAIEDTASVVDLSFDTPTPAYETLIMSAYLHRKGKTMSVSKRVFQDEAALLQNKVMRHEITTAACAAKLKAHFVCDAEVGSDDWRTHVRNYVALSASSARGVIPATQHLALQATRVRFVVFKYCARAHTANLKPAIVVGCNPDFGYCWILRC
jgi:hypothetical protein